MASRKAPDLLTKRSVAAQQRFLKAFVKVGNVSLAAKSAKIRRQTHYEWLERDAADGVADHPDSYAKAYAEAEAVAIDLLEGEAVRRAKDGVLEPVFQGGKRVGSIRRYSDTLLIFLLKGRKPEMYRERFEHTGKNGGPIAVAASGWDLTKLSDDEFENLRALHARAGKPLANGHAAHLNGHATSTPPPDERGT